MQELSSYFPELSDTQKMQMAQLGSLYREWNSKINVVSRKDIDNLYTHHVLHSLAIAKFIGFKADTKILDFGTGGGFPGIPLAIVFPHCQFKLIDGTGKKIMVAKAVADTIGLKNVEAVHERGEDEKGLFDFVVSRAVMPLPRLSAIVRKNISHHQHNALPNGIITLKGGDLTEELKPFGRRATTTPITDYFKEEWFEDKKIVYVAM